MSEMGKAATITGVLNNSLDAGPLKPVNIGGIIKYYCSNCYGTALYYKEIESGVYDIACLTCNKHWTKAKKMQKICQKRQKTLDKGE